MSYYKAMDVAQCPICRSTDVIVRRNGDGLLTATCRGCGHVTQPELLATDMESQLRWIPVSELPQERRL